MHLRVPKMGEAGTTALKFEADESIPGRLAMAVSGDRMPEG